jgi:hypothetical protein
MVEFVANQFALRTFKRLRREARFAEQHRAEMRAQHAMLVIRCRCRDQRRDAEQDGNTVPPGIPAVWA